jgi:membrane fusion protein, multidrug efflux system
MSHRCRSAHSLPKRCLAGWPLLITLYFLALPSAEAAPARSATFDCLIEPRLRLELAAPAAGILQEVLVDRGDHVRKGDILARLDSTVEAATVALDKARAASEAAIASRSARVEFLTRRRDRFSQLQSRGAVPQAEFDEAAADLAIAKADLAEARDQRHIAGLEYDRSVASLNQRSIRSPIDGIVVERKLAGGEYAYDQAPILVLAEVDPLNVEVYLPIAFFPKIRTGMIASVRPSDPIGGEYRAAVEIVDTVFDARSGTFGVRLKLPNPGYRIPAGLRCEVDFPAG